MNSNINFQTDFLYLIVDEKTDGILAVTDSADVASGISLFSPRLRITLLETNKKWLKASLRDANLRDPAVHLKYQITKNQLSNKVRTILPQDEHIVTDEYIAYKNEILKRMNYHDRLASYCYSSASATQETAMLEKYADSIIRELSKCNISEDVYSPAIINYAKISGIDNLSAFKELELHIDNMSQIRLRNLAVYIKYRNLLNKAQCTTEDLEGVLTEALGAIYGISQL